MEWKDFKGLKWYLLFSLAVIGFHGYSQSVGWKWINGTKKQTTKGEKSNGHVYRYYHK
jgi:hypothetical protein